MWVDENNCEGISDTDANLVVAVVDVDVVVAVAKK